jgi:hypothetical protein
MESTNAKTGGRSLKLVAAARSVSGIVLIAIMAFAFVMRKPLPLLVYLALALASAGALTFLGLWKQMTGKRVVDRSFGGFAFLLVLGWVLVFV